MPSKLYQFGFHQLEINGGKRLRDIMDEHGVVVVTNVISPAEVEAAKNGMTKWITEKTGCSIDSPELYSKAAKATFVHRIVKHYGAGQAQFMWDLRTHPNIIRIFQMINSTHDLRCGFDGFCVMPPPEHLGPRHKAYDDNSKGWLHRDQSLVDMPRDGVIATERSTIQGLVNLIDASSEDGTFLCMPGTHTLTERIRERCDLTPTEMKPQWIKIPDEELTRLEAEGYRKFRVPLPAGSMVLWDSRTIHSNCYPIRGRSDAKWRMCAYICMFPERPVKKEPANRIKLFLQRATTDHRGLKNNGARSRWDTGDTYMTPPPKMTPVGWKLIHGLPIPVPGAIEGEHYVV